MKVLVVSQFYYPEPGATSNRMKAFVEALVDSGHEVTVLCEFPNHPSGILAKRDRWRLFRIEDHKTHRIIRTFVLTFPTKNNIKRMLFYLSFSFSSFIAGLFIKKQDIIVASSPPLFHVISTMVVSILKRSAFFLDIRDLWPDTALEIGAVTNRRLLKWGSILERKLYKKASIITVVSHGIKRAVEERGGDGKTSVIYNGTENDVLDWSGDAEAVRKSLGWENKIIICYAGLIGLGQNIAGILPEISGIENKEIRFVFIGDGPGKKEMRDEIARGNLNNVEILDVMPREKVIPYIYASDVMMVILRETAFFNSAIPSKFFDYLAAGKPVITNVDGELRKIMEENKAGIYFSLNNKGSFKMAVNSLANDAELRIEMGRNGRKLVSERFIRKKIMKSAVELVEKMGNSDANFHA